MDDDEDEREFSKSIVYDFFQQARTTFEKMENSLCVNIYSLSVSCYFHPSSAMSFFVYHASCFERYSHSKFLSHTTRLAAVRINSVKAT